MDQKDYAQEQLRQLSGPRIGWYRPEDDTPDILVFAVSLSEATLEPLVHYWRPNRCLGQTRTLRDMMNPAGSGYAIRFLEEPAPDDWLAALGVARHLPERDGPSGPEVARSLRSSVYDLPWQRCGWYRHYKGGEYFVFAATESAATGEMLVHYWAPGRGTKGQGTRWTRTRSDFRVDVQTVAGDMPRFGYLREPDANDLRRALGLEAP